MQKEIPEGTVKCPHCFGTGICKHAVSRHTKQGYWFQCDKCGRGIIAQIDESFSPPVCSVCGGKGIVRV